MGSDSKYAQVREEECSMSGKTDENPRWADAVAKSRSDLLTRYGKD